MRPWKKRVAGAYTYGPLPGCDARPPDTVSRASADELVSNVGDLRPVGRIEPLHDVAEVNF